MARKTRFTSTFSPGTQKMPGVGRDPGLTMKPKSFQFPRGVDPRGEAMAAKAQAKYGLGDAQRALAATTRESGARVADSMQALSRAQSQQGEAVSRSGVALAQAQEAFGRSFSVLANAFENLGKMRKPKEDELAVTQTEFEFQRRSLDFQLEEKKNPNQKKLSGKAYLDDYDERQTKYVIDEGIKATEEKLGYKIDGEARDKVTALALRTRIRGLEQAANDEHERGVVQMISTAEADAIESSKLIAEDGDIGAGIARGEKIAERLNGVASPEKYLSFKEATKVMAYEQGIRYRLNKGDVAGAKAIYAQLTGIAGERATTNVRLLIDAANERGLPPEFLVALSHHETAGTFSSKIRPIGKGGKPMSSAAGLGQMTSANSKAYLGVSDASLASPATQAEGVARFTEDHFRGLRKFLGRTPTYGELMLAHFVGFGRAARIIQAVYNGKGDVPLNQFLPAEVIRNVNMTDAPTAEAALRKAETVIQTSLEKVYDSGVMTGKDLPQDAAAIPIDDVHRRIGGLIEAYEKADAEDADDRELRDETVKVGADLMYAGKLTQQWVQANRELLTPSDYKMFSKALIAPADNRKTDPSEYLRLDALVDENPNQAKEELKDLWLTNNIASADFHRLYGRAHREADPLQGNPVKREIRNLVRGHLTPGRDLNGAINKAEYNRQFEATAAFDDWVGRNPNATREEMYKAGQDIIKFFGSAKYQKDTSLLERPKFVNKNPQDITIEDVAAASARLQAELKAGTMTPDDVIRQMKINQAWLDVLKYKEAKGK